MSLACANGMTLGATRFEKLSTTFGVTYSVTRCIWFPRAYMIVFAYQERKA